MPTPSNARSSSARDKGMVAFIIVALALAGFIVYRTVQSQQVHVTGVIHGVEGHAAKLEAMKAMKEQAAPGSQGGAADQTPSPGGAGQNVTSH